MLPSLQASCLSPPQGPDGDRVLCSRHCLCCPTGLVTVFLPDLTVSQEAPTSALPGECPLLVTALPCTCSLCSAPAVFCVRPGFQVAFCKGPVIRWDLIPSYPEAELTGQGCLMACTLISPESPSCLPCSRKSVNKR